MAGHRAFAELLDRITTLRTIGIETRAADGVHPERLRQLAQEGARLSAQHLAGMRPARRHAVLVATVLETTKMRIDDAVLMFDRIIGRQFRRAERRAEAALKRDRRTINSKIQLLARLGEALIEAKRSGEDALEAVAAIVSWDELDQEVREARGLLRPDALDPVELAAASHPLLRRIGPAFVAAFAFGAVPACADPFNGVLTATIARASDALAGGVATILRSPSSYSPDRISAAYSGGALTDAEVASLHAHLGAYLTSLGA